MIFNETKNFFDQNFPFYNWSKHKNFKRQIFGGRFFFFCCCFFVTFVDIRRLVSGAAKTFFPVYPSTSNIFRGMNYWIFRSISIIWLGQRLKYGELGEAVKFLSWFRFDVSFFLRSQFFACTKTTRSLNFCVYVLIFCKFFFSLRSYFRIV